MSSNPEQPKPGGPLALLARHRERITYVLFGAAVVLALIPIILLIRHGTAATGQAVFWWGSLLAVSAGGCAVLNTILDTVPRLTEAEKVRVVSITLGGLIGLATVLLGFVLPWWEYDLVYGGGLKSLRAQPWALIWPGVDLVAGLLLIFISLQLGRGAERTSVMMRRLLYGYNAALTGILLLAVLLLVNLLPYTHAGPVNFLNKRFDWTASGIYTLSPGTRNFLANLKEPVKVYVLLPQNYLVTRDVQTLLDNCRTVTNEITWETVSRDRDPAAFRKLVKEYAVPNSEGLLVVYGKAPRAESDFIKFEDLRADQRERRDGSVEYVFTGEDALMRSLRFLAEGKKRGVVYFTQGNGELSLSEADPGGGPPLGVLRTKLQQNNYEVKGLELDLRVKSVPADADVVVVARPTNEVPANAVGALRDYLRGAGGKKKGRLIVLTDVVTRNGEMVKTGLEALLEEYGVRVGNDRILSLLNRPPTALQAVTDPRSANPIGKPLCPAWEESVVFQFNDVRTVGPARPANPAAPDRNQVQELLLVFWQQGIWAEKDLRKDPTALVAEVRLDEEKRRELLSRRSLPMAVTVVESQAPPGLPNVPGHESLRKEQPRMVVFGDADWVTSESLNSRVGASNSDLFVSCLSWLREKSDVGKQAEGKERKQYNLNMAAPNVARLQWLPVGLILLAVVGTGCGIWVVRRR